MPNPNRPTGRQRPFGLVSAVVTNKGRAVIGIRVQREPAVNGRLGLLVNPHSLGATEGICFRFLMAAVHLRSRGKSLPYLPILHYLVKPWFQLEKLTPLLA